jgi:hypothetical protein
MTDAFFTAIDHIQLAMPVGGEETARRFYVDVLGMTELAKPPELAKRGGCWFLSGTVQVHLGVENDFRPAKKLTPPSVARITPTFWYICAARVLLSPKWMTFPASAAATFMIRLETVSS